MTTCNVVDGNTGISLVRCFVYVGFPVYLIAVFVFEKARPAVLRVRSLLIVLPCYVHSKTDRRGRGRWLVMTGWFRSIV